MDPENFPTFRTRLLTGLAALLAVPVLYLAAFGPFCYLYARAGLDDKRLLAIYFPLRSLADRSPGTRSLFFAYANWFFDLGERHGHPAGETPAEEP